MDFKEKFWFRVILSSLSTTNFLPKMLAYQTYQTPKVKVGT